MRDFSIFKVGAAVIAGVAAYFIFSSVIRGALQGVTGEDPTGLVSTMASLLPVILAVTIVLGILVSIGGVPFFSSREEEDEGKGEEGGETSPVLEGMTALKKHLSPAPPLYKHKWFLRIVLIGAVVGIAVVMGTIFTG